MQYTVTIREKGKTTALQSNICIDDEIGMWCERGKAIARERNKPILVEFRPREQIYEFQPVKRG